MSEVPHWEALREAGRAIKARDAPRPSGPPERLEDAVTRAGGIVHWAVDAADARPRSSTSSRRHGAREVVKVKAIATDEIGLNGGARGPRDHGGRDGPRRADLQLAGRDVLALPRAGDPPNRAEIAGRLRPHLRRPDLDDEPADAAPRPPAGTCASGSCAPGVAISGANFAVAETGTSGGRRVEGNGRMCLDPPPTCWSRSGHREGRPPLPRPGRLPPASRPVGHRRADEPVHVDLDRRHPGRRAAGVPPRPARQRPHATPSPTRSGGEALSCIRCSRLPQHLPGLPAHRRPRLRLGLPRPDRRDPDAAPARARGPADSLPVRLDRCAARAPTCAR